MWKEDLFTIDGIEFMYSAKVFEEGSQLGINNGRISKLAICRVINNVPDWRCELVGYDRGWYIKPESELDKKALNYVLELYK